MRVDGNSDTLTSLRSPTRLSFKDAGNSVESEEDACVAFGYLRSSRERVAMLECRHRNGNMEAFAYNLLGSLRYNPSGGLLLRFSGDVTTLILISGSNLDVDLKDRAVNLLDRGILKHRITWVREMDEDEVRRSPEGQPIIDGLRIGECDSEKEVGEWIALHAPLFARSKTKG